MAIELPTLFLAGALAAETLGLLMIVFWWREGVSALAWWGMAYVLGGAWLIVWTTAGSAMPEAATAFLHAGGFIAWGLGWTAARVFHGRKPLPPVTLAGALIWLGLVVTGATDGSDMLLIAGTIVAVYAALTAHELWRERRKSMRRRWYAQAMPLLNGAALMLPLVLAEINRLHAGAADPSSGWVLFYAAILALYAFGCVFIIAILVADRLAAVHKTAALTDPLTGIFNRRGFFEAAERLRAYEARGGNPVSALIFDLDHFKSINDRFGHLAGDDVLRQFAKVLGAGLRVTDIVGRLGGEEFVALLPCTMENAAVAAERVRAAFEDSGASVDGLRVQTTVSIGVAEGAPETTLERLLAAADAALLRAKRQGRNRIELASGEVDAPDRVRFGQAVAVTETREDGPGSAAAAPGAIEPARP